MWNRLIFSLRAKHLRLVLACSLACAGDATRDAHTVGSPTEPGTAGYAIQLDRTFLSLVAGQSEFDEIVGILGDVLAEAWQQVS